LEARARVSVKDTWLPKLRLCQHGNFRSQVSFMYLFRVPIDLFCVPISLFCVPTGLFDSAGHSLCLDSRSQVSFMFLFCVTIGLFCVPIGLFESAGPSLCLNFRSKVSFMYLFRVPIDLFCVITGLFCVPTVLQWVCFVRQ